MNKAILIILSAALIILTGCGDDEGFPNPLRIEILTEEEEETAPKGNITGQILFTDGDSQILAYALSSNEYVIFSGSSARTRGEDLIVFVDFPANKSAYLMADGYFQIKNVEPGTHELILMSASDVVIEGDEKSLPEGNFARIDVPTSRWTVTVEPDRNTTLGALIVVVPEPEWKSGKAGQEVVVPQEPTETPVVITRPPTKPQPVDEEGLWFYYDFDGPDIDSGIVAALSGYEDPGFQDNPATIEVAGAPQLVPGVFGNAWQFNGVSDKIDLDNFEAFERAFSQETVSVWFNVNETDRGDKVSIIYEEGGGTNGMALLIADDKLIAHTRDDCVNHPEDEKSLEVPFTDAGRWHHAAIVYNAGTLTLYLDGRAVGSLETGYEDDGNYPGAISQHTSDGAIGGSQGSCYQGIADNQAFFAGKLDDFRVYNYAFTAGQVMSLARGFAVNSQEKLTTSWGSVKGR